MYLNRTEDARAREVRCTATLDGTDWYLEPDQANTAALLAGLAAQRQMPARAVTIAVATGIQESKLRNLDSGDRDSVGVFQQRPSQGWGTVEQIMDPVYATTAFYDALVHVEGYESMEITAAAQAVQHSAYPEAYGQHEAQARAWASALYGYSARTITCTLAPAATPGDPASLVARAQQDLGLTPTVGDVGALFDVTPLIGTPEDAERVGWMVAHWAVAVADQLSITSVEHAGSVWDREAGTWSTPATPPADLTTTQVLVVQAV